jgi:5'-nucleotidase
MQRLTEGAINMHFRKLTICAALAVLISGVAGAATTTVKVLAFNDFHGNLQSPGNFAGVPAGGVDYLAGYVASLKAQNPNNVVVAAGDLIGASPLISAFFHDEGTIETLNRLGLEFNAVGNHEFDEGKTELLRMQAGGCHPTDVNSCQGAAVGTPVPFEGAKFRFLAANVVDDKTGRTVFPPYGIKSFAGGIRVGFIGMTLKDTPTIVTPSGVAGLTFKDEAATVNALVPGLRARGVEAIVVLIHQGGVQAPVAPNFINDCSGDLQNSVVSPIVGIVAKLDDAVDLVVAGHTHTGFNCRLSNKAGRKIPVTQAGAFGRLLTDIDLTIDRKTRDVTKVAVNNLIVARNNAAIVPDATILGIVNGYGALVSPLANQVIGTIAAPLPNIGNAAGEMPAGDLIADAQLVATQPALFGGAQIAFMNPGGVRNPGFTNAAGLYPQDVTYGQGFTVQPFGNSLVTMTLTAQQIKDVLEQQFVGCKGQTVQRILQPSNGFKFSWSASAPPCSKIVDVELNGVAIVASGTVLAPATPYRVTVNSFLAPGGDNFTVFAQGTNLLGGAQDLDSLIAYFAAFKAPNAPYDPASPALNKPRIKRLD